MEKMVALTVFTAGNACQIRFKVLARIMILILLAENAGVIVACLGLVILILSAVLDRLFPGSSTFRFFVATAAQFCAGAFIAVFVFSFSGFNLDCADPFILFLQFVILIIISVSLIFQAVYYVRLLVGLSHNIFINFSISIVFKGSVVIV